MISAREKGYFQILVSLQIAMISAAYWGTYALLFATFYGDIPNFQPYGKYWLISVLAMMFEALTRPSVLRPSPGRVRRVAFAVTRRQWIWIVGSLTILLVFSRDLRISRNFLAVFAGAAMFVLYVGNRFLIRWFTKACSEHLARLRLRTLILGPEDWCNSIVPEIRTITSMLDVARVEVTDTRERTVEEYADLVTKTPIDLLVFPPRHLPDATVIHLLRLGDKLGFRCWLPLEITRTFGRHFHLQRVGCLDVLSPPVEPLQNTSNQFIKRLFDIAFSSVILITVLPPLCLLVKLIHWCHSPGPLFFKQSRVGQNGVSFEVYKFRSLRPENSSEATQVSKGDSRVFKGGAFLRKSSIDEMPQFWNVLKGDMSVVGPRPHMEAHDLRFREIFERYGVRKYVKPGVTGLAQVKGFRGEINRPLDLRNRVRMDNFYITHWDVLLDLGIVVMTGVRLIKPCKKAY